MRGRSAELGRWAAGAKTCHPSGTGNSMRKPAVGVHALALSVFVTALAPAQEARPCPPQPGKQLPTAYLPVVLKIHIGGFFGPSYWVELRGESLVYRVRDIDPKTNAVRLTSKVITPSASQWRRFWRAMDEVGLWRWRAHYANPGVFDGTQWRVEVVFAGRRAQASGSNAYPGEAARPPISSSVDTETSRTFNTYLRAVEDLLGGERFR